MNRIIALVFSLMTAASGLIVIGVVGYSIALALNESLAPRGQVSITELAPAEPTPVFAAANGTKADQLPL